MSWIKDLESHLSSSGVEVVPEGWLTSRQMADEMGLSVSRTQDIAREQVRSGWLEKRNFRIQVGERVLPTPHYRPAPKRTKNGRKR